MNVLHKIKSYTTYEQLLLLSFILILIKGFTYLFLGVYYPLLIALLLLLPFLYTYFKRGFKFQRAIKYWSILVICYGMVRILLHIITRFNSDGVPSGAYYQFTIWYGIKSILYVTLGVVLLRKRKLIFPIQPN